MGKWKPFHSIGLAVVIIALPAAAIGLATSAHPLMVWLASLALMAAFMVLIGHGLTGYARGVFIDERNVISLSRFQLILWTLLVLSGLFAAAMWNVAWNHDTPLAIAVPQQLWIMMGISTAALVGSPMLLSAKKDKAADPEELQKTKDQVAAKQGLKEECISNDGQILTNKGMAEANWSDLFTGEEVGNAAHVDMARLQMFFFTLITLVIYGFALGRMFNLVFDSNIEQLPDLDQSILALIGISNTGYLAAKGVSHSKPVIDEN